MGWLCQPCLLSLKPFMNIRLLLIGIFLSISAQAHAFELRQHEVILTSGQVETLFVRNKADQPIIVRVSPPPGVQVFPRRLSLLPGQSQTLKVRQGQEPLPPDARLGFTHAPADPERSGVHSRITLRIPVRLSDR